jgi:hypothetical protein
MTKCKYYDCGWCYAPSHLNNNAVNGACKNPNECPILNDGEIMTEPTRMTNDEILKSLNEKITEATKSLTYLNMTKSSFMSAIRDKQTNIEEPKIHITKPEYFDAQTIPGYKTLYDVAERETSKRWADVLSNFIDELGGDSPALWEWNSITPTPEKVVKFIRELMELREKLAADEELDACCDWVEDECPGYARSYEQLRKYRRPQPTLKSQALRDFQTVRENCNILPEILDTIENALKSIPE